MPSDLPQKAVAALVEIGISPERAAQMVAAQEGLAPPTHFDQPHDLTSPAERARFLCRYFEWVAHALDGDLPPEERAQLEARLDEEWMRVVGVDLAAAPGWFGSCVLSVARARAAFESRGLPMSPERAAESVIEQVAALFPLQAQRLRPELVASAVEAAMERRGGNRHRPSKWAAMAAALEGSGIAATASAIEKAVKDRKKRPF